MSVTYPVIYFQKIQSHRAKIALLTSSVVLTFPKQSLPSVASQSTKVDIQINRLALFEVHVEDATIL